MESSQIAELLQPFLTAPLGESVLRRISMYIDILLRWNARVNLTAVRQPDQIITRHFGESIFTAQRLFPAQASDRGLSQSRNAKEPAACLQPNGEGTDDHLIDLGSGAGFPGLPIKICYPKLRLTLIESNHKKATFLREVVRDLALTDVDVFCGRAEGYAGDRASVVTLRAVERFEKILPVAVGLVASAGRVALLIGAAQCQKARQLAQGFCWNPPLPIPLTQNRVLLVGTEAVEPK